MATPNVPEDATPEYWCWGAALDADEAGNAAHEGRAAEARDWIARAREALDRAEALLGEADAPSSPRSAQMFHDYTGALDGFLSWLDEGARFRQIPLRTTRDARPSGTARHSSEVLTVGTVVEARTQRLFEEVAG